jgi:hypothetical protein
METMDNRDRVQEPPGQKYAWQNELSPGLGDA